MHQCSKCFENFSTLSSLNRHEKYSHNSEYNYICPKCVVKLRNEYELKQHMDTAHKIEFLTKREHAAVKRESIIKSYAINDIDPKMINYKYFSNNFNQ